MNIFSQYKGLRRENYILFFGRIVTNLGSMVYPVLTMILDRKLGMNATGVALVTMLSGILILPAGIIGGKLADSYNKKNCIIVCDLISILFFLICGLIPLSKLSIAFLFIAATFQNMEQPIYNALVADITVTKDREKAYSLMYLGANIGMVASPTIAGLLFANYLWLSFLLSAISIGCSTFLIYRQVKNITPVDVEEEEQIYQANRSGESVWSILKGSRVILLYIVVSGLYWAVYAQNGYLIPLDLGRIHGDQGAVIFGSIFSLNCILVVLLTPLFTKWFEKVSHTEKNLVGEILLFMGYGAFLLFLGKIPCYYLAIVLFTFGEIFSTLASGPYIANRIPASHRGRINGAIGFIQNFLYGMTMLGLGTIYDRFGNVAAWIFILSLLGISIVGSIAIIWLDRREYRELYC